MLDSNAPSMTDFLELPSACSPGDEALENSQSIDRFYSSNGYQIKPLLRHCHETSSPHFYSHIPAEGTSLTSCVDTSLLRSSITRAFLQALGSMARCLSNDSLEETILLRRPFFSAVRALDRELFSTASSSTFFFPLVVLFLLRQYKTEQLIKRRPVPHNFVFPPPAVFPLTVPFLLRQ